MTNRVATVKAYGQKDREAQKHEQKVYIIL
jgi:hypothetical protein